MSLLSAHNVTHVAFILILYSAAFLIYLFVNILLHIYASYVWPDDDSNGLSSRSHLPRTQSISAGRAGWHSRKASTASHLNYLNNSMQQQHEMNGKARLPRHIPSNSQQVRDAEEFELEGLMSEPETDEEREQGSSSTDSGSGRKKESTTT